MLLLLSLAAFARQDTKTEPVSKYRLLDNGLAVFLQVRDNLPMVSFAFAVNVGSKDESPQTGGLVHLLEHLIFLGGTEFHSAQELNREMRRHGAQFNAHTSHDSMTFELSLPAQYWKYGLNLMKEKVFHLKFSPEQLEKEKKIIFEEVSQNRDDPNKFGNFQVFQHLFPGHPYAQPIPGFPEVVQNAGMEELLIFYRRYFTPENCALAVVGDIDVQGTAKKVEEVFAFTVKEPSPPLSSFEAAKKLKKNKKVIHHRDIKLAHLFIAFHAPPSDHKDQLAFNILTQILGRGMNPLLRQALYKRGKPLVQGLSVNYYPLRFGGVVVIHLTTDPKKVKQARWEALKFLNNCWSFRYSIDDYPMDQRLRITDYLEAAKNTIKFNYQRFRELGLNAAITYARYVLYHKKPKPEENQEPYMERVNKIKSNGVKDAASDYFSSKKYVAITILPEKKK